MRTFNRSVATLRAFTRSTVVALLLAALPAHAIIKSQPAASGAGGSVTSVSVATANGFKGTVATATTTPAISIGTTVTGILVGNGSSVAAAAWSDVQALLSGTCNSSTLVHGDGSCSAGSSGTVTSVALTMPSVFTVTGSPITGAGTFGVTYATGQTANQVLATPDQTTGAVALRALVSGDVPPTLNGTAITVVATTNQANTGTPTIDGFATTANVSLVLDTAQSTASQNGPWIVQTGAWTRPAWYPTGGTTQVNGYSTVIVRQGTLYIGSRWKQTNAAAITIDTTSTTWVVLPQALNVNTVTAASLLPSTAIKGLAPSILYAFGVPVILPSSGSIGNNGALTLTTNAMAAWQNCYMFFPAGAIASGVPGVGGGLYFVQMSSSSAGTIFNNQLTSGAPFIPASPTAFVTTGPGAYTQTTATNIVLLTLPIPANSMGANGILNYEGAFYLLNNADTKSYSTSFGGTTVQNAISGANLGYTALRRNIRNRGLTNLQDFLSTSAQVVSDLTSNASTFSTSAIDTTVSQNLVISANIATATDLWILAGLNVTATFAN